MSGFGWLDKETLQFFAKKIDGEISLETLFTLLRVFGVIKNFETPDDYVIPQTTTLPPPQSNHFKVWI